MSAISTRFLALVMFLSGHSAYCQVYGCKDPLANNYNPAATVNNGSCTYSTTNYTPPVKVKQLSNALAETSGLQWAANTLWTFNDGGNSPVLYRIDTLTSTILQTIILGGATNTDWEDIAFDGTSFYIGDFGNNANGARTNLKIYKFPLSSIPDYTKYPQATIPSTSISVINFTYSDQPQPPLPVAANTTKFDCEAMIIDNGKIHLFTKNWTELKTTHYVINSLAAGSYVATPVETLATGYLVTAIDKAVNKNIVALTGYQVTGFGNHYMHLLSDYSLGKYFNGNKRQINLPSALVMGQAEGITFRNSTYGYISNERVSTPYGTINPMLRSFNIQSFVPATNLSASVTGFKAKQKEFVIQLKWSMGNEENVDRFEIERSLDGRDFTTIGKMSKAAGSTNYQWNDINQQAEIKSFYRLKIVEISGAERYSDVAEVASSANVGSIRLFPNPVTHRSFKLYLNSVQKGQYMVKIFKADGGVVLNRNINYDGRDPFLLIDLPFSSTSGLYTLTIANTKSVYYKNFSIIW